MNLPNASALIPLSSDADGTIRVAATRVTLDTVIQAFKDGSTAEEIVFQYPVLELSDVYAVIGYYLKNQVAIERYISTSKSAAEQIRSTHQQPADIRQRLVTRQIKGRNRKS